MGKCDSYHYVRTNPAFDTKLICYKGILIASKDSWYSSKKANECNSEKIGSFQEKSIHFPSHSYR